MATLIAKGTRKEHRGYSSCPLRVLFVKNIYCGFIVLQKRMDIKKESQLIRTLQLWSDEETQILLDKYAHYLPEIGPTKNLKNKKEMWMQISQEIAGKSPKQCEERYKTVTKRKKSAMAHTVGAKKKKIETDDSIESEGEEVQKSVCEEYYIKFDKSKTKTVQDTLLEIAQKKEQARERRHREKMDAIGKIHKLLAKMVETKGK